MTGLVLALVPLGLSQAASPAGPAQLEFRDAAEHDGRSLLAFRPIMLDDKPIRPVALPSPAPAGVRYGRLRVGSDPDAGLALLWLPHADGGAQLWLDADGDGRIRANERHTFRGRELGVWATFTLRSAKGPQRVKRWVIFRRSALGDGLSYAVRGYARGALRLGGQEYPVLLSDGNADGAFDDPAADRLWVDLDRDGRFDPLTEQFPLGGTVTVGGRPYVVRSDATAFAVWVHARAAAHGSVRLALLGKDGRPADTLTADLVSEFGELVPVTAPGRAVTVPAGRYRVASLRFTLTDAAGRTWTYHFAGGTRHDIEVRPDGETVAEPLAKAVLRVGVTAREEGAGGLLTITPKLDTPAGLYLMDCTVREAGAVEAGSGKAEIRLVDGAGAAVDRAYTGFM